MTDMPAKIGEAVLAFVRWWAAELRSMLPGVQRLPFWPPSPQAEIRPGRTSTAIIRVQGDEVEELLEPLPTTAFTAANWAEVVALTTGFQTKIILTSPIAHTLTLKLPTAARNRLSAAIPIQLRDHSPLEPTETVWGVADVRQLMEKLEVDVIVTHRATIDMLVAGFFCVTDRIPPIFAEYAGGRTLLRAAERPTWRLSRDQLPWLVSICLLVITPVLALGLLTYEVGASEARVLDLQESAGPILQNARWLRQRAQAARAAQVVISTPEIMPMLAAISSQLPDTASLTGFEVITDGTVGLEVVASDPDAARQAISGIRRLPSLHQIGELKGPDGVMHLRFSTGPR